VRERGGEKESRRRRNMKKKGKRERQGRGKKQLWDLALRGHIPGKLQRKSERE
jgi:hypothetical protein